MLRPLLIKKGDRICMVAPAGKVQQGSLDASIRIIQEWGLIVELGEHVYDTDGYFSSTDANRLSDLQQALDNPEISAIIFARGGYGTTRVLEEIDFSTFIQHPKWVVGFSDITALHLKIVGMRVCSIHGAMGTTLAQDQKAVNALKELLFTGKIEPLFGTSVRKGKIEAEIVGGNLALLADSMGTPNELDCSGKILFIEDIGEPTYKIDRMMHQLLRSGKLEQLSGLVVGHFSEVSDEKEFGARWDEVICGVVDKYSFPVATKFPIGHEPNNYPVMIGGKYRLDVTADLARLQLLITS